jgi:glycerol-3-phosphate dehydrogenase
LVPSFDAAAVIHSFAGRRAKSSTGDWVIRPSAGHPACIHAAGIDSPGLAGSPAIALRVVALLRAAGLAAPENARFNAHRRAIVVPKRHAASEGPRGVRLVTPTVPAFRDAARWPPPEAHVVCRCEKVTEAEVLDAARRSLPCESTQAVRKRTRAGMGHCQGEFCEERVKAVLARELGARAEDVEGRPWPASSILPSRWPTEAQREAIAKLG